MQLFRDRRRRGSSRASLHHLQPCGREDFLAIDARRLGTHGRFRGCRSRGTRLSDHDRLGSFDDGFSPDHFWLGPFHDALGSLDGLGSLDVLGSLHDVLGFLRDVLGSFRDRNRLLAGRCGRRVLLDGAPRSRLLDEQRWLRLLGVGLLRASLRPLLLRRTVARLAVAIAVAMPIAPAAPLLFAFLHGLLARIGEPAFRTILVRLRLGLLLRSRRSLLLMALAGRA